MKKFSIIALIASLSLVIYSCEKDNLKGPNATFYGELRDRMTGELIPQEVSDGSRIYYIERGWDNPPVQNMVVKSDGTFKNSMMFSGDYFIVLNRGNYVPIDTVEYHIGKGGNFQSFEVNPYLRIMEPAIVKNGDIVTAKFKLEQVTSNQVRRITLFAHSHIDVSSRLNLVNTNVVLDRSVNDGEEFTLTIDLSQHASRLKKGKSYYFRVGAQSHGNEAKYNYAKSVKIAID